MRDRMLGHRPGAAIVAVALVAIAFAACTKRSATPTGWAAPVPTGTATHVDSTRPPAPPTARPTDALANPGGPPGAQNELAQGRDGVDQRPAERRPAVKDFSAVADLVDVYFEFDKYDIQPAQARALDSNARWLRSNRDLVLIEGHCDERGTSEYNLALGERRAASALNYLVSKGVSASRITIVSYGKERPQCTDQTESCWRRNRRAHFLVKRQ